MKIFLYSVIGDWEASAIDIKNQIADAGSDPIELHINSPGGNVFEGFAIYNQLKSIDNEVIVNIDGLCGSIATLIALAGDVVNMSEVGDFFIHNSSVYAGGNKEDLEDQIKLLDQIDNTILKVYQAKTGLRKRELVKLMDAETHFTAKEAKEMGFIDNISNPVKAAALLNNYHNMKTEKQKGILAQAAAILGFAKAETEEEKQLVDKMLEEVERKTTEEAETRLQEAKGGEGAEILTAEMVTFKEFQELKNTYTPLFKSLLNLLEEMPSTEQMEEMIDAKVQESLNATLQAIRSKTVAPRNATSGLQVNTDEEEALKKQKEEERKLQEENRKKRETNFINA